MSSQSECLTLDELSQMTGLKRNDLTVQLHYLHKEGLITRHWKTIDNSKKRIYCLKKELIINKV